MAILISTLGTSPGGVAEIVEYLLTKGININRVVLLRTKNPEVEYCAKIVRLLISLCINPGIEIEEVIFNKEDIENEEDLRRFKELLTDVIERQRSEEIYFDVTGGRKVMSIVATIYAKSIGKDVLIAYVPHERYRYIMSRVATLKNYDIESIVLELNRGKKIEDLVKEKPWVTEVKNILCNEIICKDLTIISLSFSTSNVIAFLEDAYQFLKHAYEEYEKFKSTGDAHYLRNCAEKAWNAIVQATNALILSFGFSEEYIKSHKLRRQALDKIIEIKPEIEEYGFRDRYSARERYLHELCFYENECPPNRIELELKKVEKYLEDVKKFITK